MTRCTSRVVRVICSLLACTLLIGVPAAGATPPANGEPPQLSGIEPNGDLYVGATLYATAGRWSGVPATVCTR